MNTDIDNDYQLSLWTDLEDHGSGAWNLNHKLSTMQIFDGDFSLMPITTVALHPH